MSWKQLREQYVSEEANMKGVTREINYIQAAHEAFDLALEHDPNFYMMGQNVSFPIRAAYGTMKGLAQKYGEERIFDTPISEALLTGMAVGSAMYGKRPLFYNDRPDYFFLGMSQIVNQAAKWHFMSGGQFCVPAVFWATITRGKGAGAQHCQSPQSMFAHIPGLKVVMPSTPYDSKGLLLSAIADNNPVIFIEHRWFIKADYTGIVPEGIYFVPFGKGVLRHTGGDLTIVGTSHAVVEAQKAAEELESEGIQADVIDLRTVRPLDEDMIVQSVKKTGRLMVVDIAWKHFGMSAEIAAIVAEKAAKDLKTNVRRVTPPESPIPAGATLEHAFYVNTDDIKRHAREMVAE